MPKNLSKKIDLPEELFLSLIQGCNVVRKWASHLVETQGMTVSEYHFLRVVQNRQPITATVMKERLRATAPTIAQMIAKLEHKKFIKRMQHKNDKRVQHITLTALGKKVVNHTRKTINNATDRLPLSSDALHTVIANIETLSSTLSSSHSSYGY